MRRIMTLWAALVIAVTGLGTGIARAAENNTDRPGGDYREFSVPFGGDYRSCESACNSDSRCRAWTYLRSDTFPPTGGQCYLKDRVSPPTPNDCCVSGLKAIGGGGGGGGRGITVYQDINFAGDRQTFNRDVPNLIPEGWNDQISSFRIPSGETWQFCEHDNYTGRCFTASSDAANIIGTRMNDRITSMRRLGGRPGPGPGRAGITVYEDVRYGGRSETFSTAIPNLIPEGWNDVISSFQIRGGAWEVCQDSNYRGRCRVFNADTIDLVALGWNDRISSVRPVGGAGPGDGGDDWPIGPGMRDGFDRPGGDYRDFDVSRGGPAVCADTCNRDPVCRAWSFMRPARFGVAPKCYLKGVVTAERRDARFVSGVSTSREAIGPRMDDGADRSDNSYRTFNLTEANPRRCQEACDTDRRCRAWTYFRPGSAARTAQCVLSSPAPSAQRDSCCVSGVTGGSAGGDEVPPGAVNNLRRLGTVLSNFRTDEGAEVCQEACTSDRRCGGWTYVRPGYEGPRGRCYLLRRGSSADRDACCISSVDDEDPEAGGGRTEVILPGMRDGYDLPGFDLRPPFALPAADPELCRRACNSEFMCRAWVYARPGTRNRAPVCYLKSIRGPKSDDSCCVIGNKSSLF